MVTICFQFHGKNFEFMFGVVNGSFYRYTISTFLAQLLTDLLAFFSDSYFINLSTKEIDENGIRKQNLRMER